MELKEIANILYNLSLGMDYKNYIDYAELEIESIQEALEQASENPLFDSLMQALENIALSNSDLLNWHVFQR